MATASILVAAAPGRPANVLALGSVAVALTNADNTGVVSWLWTLVDAPNGSAAVLSNPAIANPTLSVLDVAGTYWLRLQVNGSTGNWETAAEVDEIVIRVRTANLGLVIPAPGEEKQSGTDGWADWVSGMNEALLRLDVGRTLQAAYDASGATPRIDIDPASGPVQIRRDNASAGDILRLLSTTATRFAVDQLGRIDALAATLSAGNTALRVSSSAVTGGNFLHLRDTGTAAYFLVGTGLTIDALAKHDASSSNNAFVFDGRGFTSSIFLALDGAGSGGDPVRFDMLPTGALVAQSKSAAAYGLDVDAKAATTGLLRLRDTGNAVAPAATLLGLHVDGSSMAVANGRTWRGVLSEIRGAIGATGDAAAFAAYVTTQDTVAAYRVGAGALGATMFIAYHHLHACSFASPSTQWALVPIMGALGAPGASSYLEAPDDKSIAEAPLLVPPGGVLREISVRVAQAGGLGDEIRVTLSVQYDTNGAGGQVQAVVYEAYSAGAGDSDVVIAIPASTVASASALSATQQSYMLQVHSGSIGDKIYAGHCKYEYDQIQHGC